MNKEIIFHVNDDFASANPEDIKKFVNTELAIRLENLLKSCGKGEENALKMRQIKDRLNNKNDRKIRLTIEAMRLSKQHLILSSENGYWYAKSPEEVRKSCAYWRSYIADLSHLIKSLEDAAIKEYGEKYYQIPLGLK